MSDNPKAFPANFGSDNCGMDLRDYFAAKTMQSFVTAMLQVKPEGDCDTKSKAACRYAAGAYLIAEAMLAERSKAK